jgi:hypothetical protein
MHFIKRIEHPACLISLFQWNGKYIVKFEMNQMEQTYKIAETEIYGMNDVEEAVNEEFINSVLERFRLMGEDWYGRF